MEIDKVPSIAKYLSVIFMFGWIGRMTVWNFLPIFFKQNIESVFIIGILTSIPAIITIIMDIPVGNLVQRSGEKIVIFIGLLTTVLSPLLYITAIPALLITAKLFEGFTKALVWNGSWSLSLKAADESVESETVSIFLLGINLSVILGPILGGFLITSHGFTAAFVLWIFTSLIAILLYYSYIGIEAEMPLEKSVDKLRRRKTYVDDWHHLKNNWENLRFPFALIFLYSIIFSFYWLAIPLLLDEIGADYVTMGIVFGVAALPKVFQFIFGSLADSIGQYRTMALLAFSLTPVLVVLNYVSNIWIIGILFFIARTLSSGFSPAAHALFDANAPDELESEMTGFLELFKHAGQVVGPFMAGTIASIWSINASFLAASLISAVIFVLSFTKKE